MAGKDIVVAVDVVVAVAVGAHRLRKPQKSDFFLKDVEGGLSSSLQPAKGDNVCSRQVLESSICLGGYVTKILVISCYSWISFSTLLPLLISGR